MSEGTATKRRIRAQRSVRDPQVMGFTLDSPVQNGRKARFSGPADAPLPKALFAIAGVDHVEVAEATIWVRKDADGDWSALKPAIAAAIRQVLDSTEAPLGTPDDGVLDTPNAPLLRAVEEFLTRQVNPAIASHGGQITVEQVIGGRVFLRMSGGCQGCAASAATLREGVERMLRAALPGIEEIVDVTDHASGSTPFYAPGDQGATRSPMLSRPVPPGVITFEGGQITLDPDFLAPRLGLAPEALREGLRKGDIVSVSEIGEGAEDGKTRIVLRSATRAWAAEIMPDGSAHEVPPPRATDKAAQREATLVSRLRAHLEGLGEEAPALAYGKLARALGLWAPGSTRRVTSALETTMREDAAAERPFIAARTASRGTRGLPGEGFFSLASTLGRGPEAGESKRAFVERERARLRDSLRDAPASAPDAATTGAAEARIKVVPAPAKAAPSRPRQDR